MERRKIMKYFRTLKIKSTGKLNEELETEIASIIKTLMKAVEIERYDLAVDYMNMTLVSWIKMFVGQGW